MDQNVRDYILQKYPELQKQWGEQYTGQAAAFDADNLPGKGAAVRDTIRSVITGKPYEQFRDESQKGYEMQRAQALRPIKEQMELGQNTFNQAQNAVKAQLEALQLRPVDQGTQTWLKEQGVPEGMMPQSQKEAMELFKQSFTDPATKASLLHSQAMLEATLGGQRSAEARAASEKAEKERKDIEARTVPGLGVAYSADDAKNLKEAQPIYQDIDKHLEELESLRTKHGGNLFNKGLGSVVSADVDRAKQLSAQVRLKLGQLANLRVASPHMEKLIDNLIPKSPLSEMGFNAAGVDTVLSNIKDYRKDLKSDFTNLTSARIAERTGGLSTKNMQALLWAYQNMNSEDPEKRSDALIIIKALEQLAPKGPKP